MKHYRLETVSIKDHPDLGETWVQQVIADDPAILGLGDLVLKDKERRQPGAGRLDLLLQDPDTDKRYEVEVQLGPTDESHIIRTIEYWDIEKRRYPQYDHCAVLIAEDITSRFLNIVSLFNGAIPLVAIQMKAVKVEDGLGLTFTKVMDELARGLIDEDEGVVEPADRDYWVQRGSKKTVELADGILDLIHTFAPDVQLKYNKFYIGLAERGSPNNFAAFKPKKQWMNTEVRMAEDSELDARLEETGLDAEYMSKWGKYRLRIRPGELQPNREVLLLLLKRAHDLSEA